MRLSPSEPLKRFVTQWLPVVVTGCAGLLVFHRVTLLSGFDLVQADVGDSRLVVFLLEHWHRVLAGQAEWASPSMFYPVKGVLGYSEMLFGMGVFHALFRSLGLGLFQATNATLVLLSLLAYLSAYWLLHRVLKLHYFGSIVGAFFFAFAYPKFAQLAHLQLRFDFFQPLALGVIAPLFLDERAMDSREVATRTSLFAGLICVAASTAFYNAWFFAFFVGWSTLLAASHRALRTVIARRWREGRRILWVPLALCVVMLAPFLIVYVPALRLGVDRTWERTLEYLPRLSSYVWLGPEHLLWGSLPFNSSDGVAYPIENRLGFGVAVTGLVLVGWAWAVRHFVRSVRGRDQSSTLRSDLLSVVLVSSLLVTALTVPWGPLHPWKAVYEFVPGASAMVGIGRWVLTLTLPAAILIAAAAGWLQQRVTHSALRGGVLLAAGMFIAVEQAGSIPALYSAEVASQYHRKLAKMIPASCEAFLLVPPVRPENLPVITRQDFDETKYLAANPDVTNWPGSPWDHYTQFGYREGRVLDKETTFRARPSDDEPAQVFHNFNYHLAAMIASAMSGKPTVNGASGLSPANYPVANLSEPDVARRLGAWMSAYPGKQACLIVQDMEPYSLADRGPRSAFLGIALMD